MNDIKSLIYNGEKVFNLGPEGFEPSTSGLKGRCSTDWAIDPTKKLGIIN